MGSQLPVHRTVIVRFPDGDKQYWLTDKQFSEGETIGHNGRRWIVASVARRESRDTHLTVLLREAD